MPYSLFQLKVIDFKVLSGTTASGIKDKRLKLSLKKKETLRPCLDIQGQLRLDARGDDGQALGLPLASAWQIMLATSWDAI